MSVTFTMFMLWYAGVPNIRGSFVFIALLADLCNYGLKKIIGLEGER